MEVSSLKENTPLRNGGKKVQGADNAKAMKLLLYLRLSRGRVALLVENEAERQKVRYVRRTECMERHTISAFPRGQLS